MSVCVRGSGPPTAVIVLPLAQSLPRERPSSAEGRASEVQRADARRSAQRVLRHLELEDDHVHRPGCSLDLGWQGVGDINSNEGR